MAAGERSWLATAALVSLIGLSLGVAWLLIGGEQVREDIVELVDRGATEPAG